MRLPAPDREELAPCPAFHCGTALPTLMNIIWMWPAITSVSAGRRALVVHRLTNTAPEALEQLHVEVPARTDAEGAVVELARLLPWRARSAPSRSSPAASGIDDQRMVDGDEAGDRREVLDRIVVQLRGRGSGLTTNVALRPDRTACSRPAPPWRHIPPRSDCWRPACSRRWPAGPRLRETLRQDAAERVGHPAGRCRDHDGHRFGRITRPFCGRHRRQTHHHHSR